MVLSELSGNVLMAVLVPFLAVASGLSSLQIKRRRRRVQLVGRRASNRKVSKPWFDSWCGSASLCPWERYFMLFPVLGPSRLPVVAAQPDERHTNRTGFVLEWYDRHKAYNICFKTKKNKRSRL